MYAVKVLDFGLAKLTGPADAGHYDPNVAQGFSPADLSQSPTMMSPAQLSGVGMILGTAAYMAPEQARGKTVDKRADVWAFGAVLFEMLTGTPPFPGDDLSHVLARVIERDPDWSALPPSTPAPIYKLIQGCLVKDRRERVPDIAVARLAIKETLALPAGSAAAVAVAPPPRPRPLWRRAVPVMASAAVASALGAAAAWTLKPTPPRAVTRFAFALGEGQGFTSNSYKSLAVSPDGTVVVFVADDQLYLRSMSDLEARPVAGTQRQMGNSPLNPVFSPDGQSLAFYAQSDRTIKKIAVTGGAAVTICSANPVFGMTWGPDGIVFGQGSQGILRAPSIGGPPEVLVSPARGELVHGPQVLPGGEWVLFTVASAQTVEAWDKANIVVQSLKSQERRTVVSGGSDGQYLPTGHLVYALGGVLFAAPFDLGHLAVAGGAVPVVEGVKRATSPTTGVAQFSVSSTGSLVFLPGPTSSSRGDSDLAFIDRSGLVSPLKLPPGAYEYPRLSPDGKRIAFGSDDGKDAIVWIYDLAGTNSMRRLTLGGRNRVPVWSADGEHIAFQSNRDGDLGIFWQRADGASAAGRLTKPEKDAAHVPETWSPDGQTLLFSAAKGSTYALAALSLSDRTVAPFGGVQSPFPPAAAFSPDGRWVAYTATVPGGNNGVLFVQPVPPNGAPYQISNGNGIHPTWSPDGKELFYGPGPFPNVLAVRVKTRPTFTFGNPAPVPRLFVERGPAYERNNDIALDGQRFLGVVAQGVTPGVRAALPIRVVLNWTEELKARVPTGRQ